MEKTFKYKTILLIVVITGFFIVTDFNLGTGSMNVLQDVKQEYMNINLVFVGFDEDYTVEENYNYLITSDINTFEMLNYNYPLNKFPHSEYDINYTFSTLTSTEEDGLVDYIDSISETVPYIDYMVNITAVEEYNATEGYEDIWDFFSVTGGSYIDAELVEEYIQENLYSELEQETSYTLYMMNFSHLDNEDHSQEHTYTYTLADADAIAVDPDHITGTIERTTIGWGGESQRFSFVDISAISMYMLYYELMFENPLHAVPYYTFYDLDSFTQTLDPYSPQGRFDLLHYISQWINGYLSNVFLSQAVYFPPVDESINLPIAVFSNISDQGYPTESISWAISSDRIKSYLSSGFPWIDWQVPIEFYDLNDYPEIYNHLAQNIQEDEDGYFIEVLDVAEIMDEKLDLFFNMEYEGTQSISLVFLNHYVRFKYGDINLGGIALGDYQITVRNPNQLFFFSDKNEPRGGLTHTIVHEIGHNLGLSHPHGNTFGHGSMFINDVMSYKYSSNGFSVFSRDTIARFHYDYYHLNAINNLTILEDDNYIGYDKVTRLLDEGYEYYQKMEYIPAILKAREAWELSLKLDKVMRKPAILSVVIVSGAVVSVSIPVATIRFDLLSKLRR